MTDDELKDLYREDDDWADKRIEAEAEKDGAKPDQDDEICRRCGVPVWAYDIVTLRPKQKRLYCEACVQWFAHGFFQIMRDAK